MKETLKDGDYKLTVENGEVTCHRINLEKKVDLKINWFKFIKHLIFNKGDRHWLLNALQYAISKENEVYGEGAADVVMFKVHFKDCIDFKKDEEKEWVDEEF